MLFAGEKYGLFAVGSPRRFVALSHLPFRPSAPCASPDGKFNQNPNISDSVNRL
jgi:hypothetical protein